MSGGNIDLAHANAWDHDTVVKKGFETIGATLALWEDTHNPHIAAEVTAFAANWRTQERPLNRERDITRERERERG